jgi:hypothetical protein
MLQLAAQLEIMYAGVSIIYGTHLTRGYDSKCVSNFVQISERSAKETSAKIRQAFREDRKVRQMKSMFNVFFDIKGIVHKKFILAG